MPPLVIRAPRDEDAAALADLLGELGYPTVTAEVTLRLRELAQSDHALVLVADLAGGPVGLVTAHVFHSIHAAAPVAWLTTLVIRQADRRQGIGEQLVVAAEAWAIRQGANRLSLTSGLHRDDAHSFYEALGYQRSGVRLTAVLPRRSS